MTNRAYKAFVDALGYENRSYWQETFVKEGVTLTWKQAREQFIDQTGCPGPANWQNGNFPPDEANYPVSGISWFEAAAYARYCGKDLPTAFHWLLTSSAYNFDARITVFSNFSGAKAPVGTYQGMGRYGVHDMAGNVREWCSNTVVGHGDQRCIMGGTHSSPHY